MSAPALALDIGGSTLAAALVDPTGSIPLSHEIPTPTSLDPTVLTAALTELITRTLATARPVAVGIGSAGPLNPTAGTVSPVNIPAWRDFPLVGTVRALVPDTPVTLAGDALCMAFGEHWRGQHDARNLLGMVVSTGVGGGLILGGTPYSGPTGNAGHIGHIPVHLDGPSCACGALGCVEALASGPAMVSWALAHGWTPVGPPDARALAESARSGDPMARQAFARGARAVAAAIASAAALVDLDVAVIGGGVAAAGKVLFDPLRTALADYAVLPFVRRIRVRPSPLGRCAGLLGAAALAFRVSQGRETPATAAVP